MVNILSSTVNAESREKLLDGDYEMSSLSVAFDTAAVQPASVLSRWHCVVVLAVGVVPVNDPITPQ